jgi:hypothetical protein
LAAGCAALRAGMRRQIAAREMVHLVWVAATFKVGGGVKQRVVCVSAQEFGVRLVRCVVWASSDARGAVPAKKAVSLLPTTLLIAMCFVHCPFQMDDPDFLCSLCNSLALCASQLAPRSLASESLAAPAAKCR